jgi:glycosyltransferase involved in cell wall biosynthesis
MLEVFSSDQCSSTDKISVVCPTFNCESYIERTLDTLLSQIVIPEEVIFSDDGSQDNTVNIIEKYRSRYVKAGIKLKVLQNPHEGPGAARNHGISSTSQTWIAFIDADDTWKPEKLKRIKQIIKEFQGVNCILHWEEYIRTNGNTTTLEHGNNYDNNFSNSEQLYRNNFLSTSAVVFRRSILLEYGGFDETLPNGQDYDLWLKLSPVMNIKIIPEILGSYIEEATSITARAYHKRIRAELLILWRHRKKGTMLLFLRKLIRILLSKQWFYTFRNLIFQKELHSN